MRSDKPLRGVLFDLDGTLVDSAADLQATLNRLLPEYGLRPLTLDEVKARLVMVLPNLSSVPSSQRGVI